jgi:hypothetical protein
MKLFGMMPVRNEDWVLGLSARAALMWCDALVILDHASTDDSIGIMADLVAEYDDRIIAMRNPCRQWEEMRHRNDMLRRARTDGATHCAIVDADEILTGNLLPTIRGHVERAGNNLLSLPGYNLRGGIARYHSNQLWGNRWFSFAFKDSPELGWNGDRFHHREPMGREWHFCTAKPVMQHDAGVMHLWGASERRLRAKSALYKLNERLRWPTKPVHEIEKMYNWAINGQPSTGYGTPDTWQYRAVPPEWWKPYAHLGKYLDVDAEPWQEAEVRRLVDQHGRSRFVGLTLFGIA